MISRLRKAKVLIVDNDEQVLTALQELLEEAGFDTCTTWSGHEALALLQSREFDVLLVDDYLPDLHSSDFLDRAGRLPVQPRIVVMHSNTLKRDEMRRYRSLRVFAVVHKHDPAGVRQAVSSCCVEDRLAKAASPCGRSIERVGR